MTAREVHQLKETTRVTLEAVARLADGDDLRRAGLPAKPSTYPAMHTCSVVTNDLWVTKRTVAGSPPIASLCRMGRLWLAS